MLYKVYGIATPEIESPAVLIDAESRFIAAIHGAKALSVRDKVDYDNIRVVELVEHPECPGYMYEHLDAKGVRYTMDRRTILTPKEQQ